MAKCKDCLHYEACLTFSKIINTAINVEKGCEHFKDCAEVVEVVRCKDCKHYDKTILGNGDRCMCMCTKFLGLTIPRPDDFCSYGERRTNERKAD